MYDLKQNMHFWKVNENMLTLDFLNSLLEWKSCVGVITTINLSISSNHTCCNPITWNPQLLVGMPSGDSCWPLTPPDWFLPASLRKLKFPGTRERSQDSKAVYVADRPSPVKNKDVVVKCCICCFMKTFKSYASDFTLGSTKFVVL